MCGLLDFTGPTEIVVKDLVAADSEWHIHTVLSQVKLSLKP